MSRSGRETLPDLREWLGGLPGCPGVVGRPSQMSGRPFVLSGSGWKSILDVWEWSGGLLDVREWLGGPL